MRLVVGCAAAYVASELALRAVLRAGQRSGFRAGHDAAVRWMLEHAGAPVGWDPSAEWVWGVRRAV